MAEKRRIYVYSTREGSLEEGVVGTEFPDDHRGHVPCCQSLPVTKVLRLGRVILPELHYPGVSHVGKTVPRAFSRWDVQRQPYHGAILPTEPWGN